MKKSIKKILVSTLAVASLSAVGVGVSAFDASADTTAPYFRMQGGAYVKAEAASKEYYGLKFIAEMDNATYESVDCKDGEYFGMLIVPYDYLETYAEAIENANGCYVTAFPETVVNLVNIDAYEKNGQYQMNGVLSSIKYANLDRDFVGIGYYYDSVAGYVYTAINETDNARSVYEVATKAIDSSANYNLSQLQCLYEYKYLTEEKQKQTAEETAKANVEKAIASQVTDRYYGVSGEQVATFDRAEYIDFVDKSSSQYASVAYYSTTSALKYAIEENAEAESGVLAITPKNYVGAKIAFAKEVETTESTYISVKMKAKIAGSPWLYAAKYNFAGNTPGYSISGYGFKNDEWITMYIPATAIGYKVGDVIDGIEFCMQGTSTGGEYMYIDEISIFSFELTEDQVATFDRAEYSILVGKGSSTESNVAWWRDNGMSAPVIENGYGDVNSGVLKMHSTGYANVKIAFPKATTVYVDTQIVLKVYATVDFRLTTYGNAGASLPKYVNATTNAWTTVSVLATDYGFKLGDTINGVEIVFYVGTVYVDEISVSSVASKLTPKLTGTQVANYDDELYSNYVKTAGGATATVADGKVTFSNAGAYSFQTLKFVTPKTVANGDYVAIRMTTPQDTTYRMYVNGADGKMTNGVEPFVNTAANSITKEWEYAKDGKMKTILLPISSFGYAIDDTMTGIKLANWTEGKTATFTVDYIEYIAGGDFTKTSALVQNALHGTYRWNSLTISHVEEYQGKTGGVTTVSVNYGAPRFYIAPVTVTANTTITITLRYDAGSASDLQILQNKANWDGTAADRVYAVHTHHADVLGAWGTITVKASDLGYAVGDKLDSVEFCIGSGTLAVTSIVANA